MVAHSTPSSLGDCQCRDALLADVVAAGRTGYAITPAHEFARIFVTYMYVSAVALSRHELVPRQGLYYTVTDS